VQLIGERGAPGAPWRAKAASVSHVQAKSRQINNSKNGDYKDCCDDVDCHGSPPENLLIISLHSIKRKILLVRATIYSAVNEIEFRYICQL
jgi:hypothetical protein